MSNDSIVIDCSDDDTSYLELFKSDSGINVSQATTNVSLDPSVSAVDEDESFIETLEVSGDQNEGGIHSPSDKNEVDGASVNGAVMATASVAGASVNGAVMATASVAGVSVAGASVNGASVKGAGVDGEEGAIAAPFVRTNPQSGIIPGTLRYDIVTGRSKKSKVLYVFDDGMIFRKYSRQNNAYQMYICSEPGCQARVHLTIGGLCMKVTTTPHNHLNAHMIQYNDYLLRETMFAAAEESSKSGNWAPMTQVFKATKEK